MSVPVSVAADAFELTGAAEVTLFKIVLPDETVICVSPRGEWVWQGDLYEEVPCHMSQVKRNSTNEKSRPKFTSVNPRGMFTEAIGNRQLENARLTRHRILETDLRANADSALSEAFRITRVVNLNRETFTVECRRPLDGAAFRLPHRSFRPPEFPFVTLR